MEQVDLTNPITVSNYHVQKMLLDVDEKSITIYLKDNIGGTIITKIYSEVTNPTGATLLHNLNTGNFTVNSLLKAVYNRLINDGVINGTVSGSPV
jgi:hypothetical protein